MLQKGGPGSGRHKEIADKALMEADRLGMIANGATIHKRANLRAILMGYADILKKEKEHTKEKLEEYCSKVEKTLEESKAYKSAFHSWIKNYDGHKAEDLGKGN